MITSSTGTYNTVYSIDLNSQPTSSDTPSTSTVSRVKRGVAVKQALWPQNATITIAFMGATEAEREYIQRNLEDTFSGLINLKLKFVEGTQGDIRISTSKESSGTWSAFGINALKVPAGKPTMHIDFDAPRDLLADILHEFGHALGLGHEHQHPDRPLDFNTPKAYEYFKTKYNWPHSYTYEQILKKYKPADVITHPYDENSVMLYPLSEEVLWKQAATGFNSTLSEEDEIFLASLYPPAVFKSNRVRTNR